MSSAITALGGHALRDVIAIAARTAEEVVGAEAELADPTLVPAEDVTGTTAHLIRDFFQHLADGTELDLAAVRAVGRRRAAQGVPLAAVLHGFRIGFRSAWAALVARVAPDDTPTLHALLAQSDAMWRLLDTYSDELRTAYRDRAAELLRVAEAERHRHLRNLLALETDTSGRLLSAEALGLPRRGRHLVLAVQGESAEHRACWDEALVARGTRVLWHVAPEGTAGIVSARTDGVFGEDALDALRTAGTCRIGASVPFDRVEDAPHALRQARIALRCLPPEHGGVQRYDQDPLGSLVAASGEDARALTRLVLRGLAPLPDHERERLMETATAWFDAGGSAGDAAEELYCHRNTVRYRLRRLEDLTGVRLKDPRSAARIHLALHTVRQHGWSVIDLTP